MKATRLQDHRDRLTCVARRQRELAHTAFPKAKMRISKLTDDMIAVIKLARTKGYFNHVIASYFVVNQGRIAEVNTGQRGAGIAPAANLPADFPQLIA